MTRCTFSQSSESANPSITLVTRVQQNEASNCPVWYNLFCVCEHTFIPHYFHGNLLIKRGSNWSKLGGVLFVSENNNSDKENVGSVSFSLSLQYLLHVLSTPGASVESRVSGRSSHCSVFPLTPFSLWSTKLNVLFMLESVPRPQLADSFVVVPFVFLAKSHKFAGIDDSHVHHQKSLQVVPSFLPVCNLHA